MDKKVTYVAVAAVVLILIAGIVIVATGGDEEEKDNTVTFLIQDDDGVFFWAEGAGDNVYAAFENATETYEIPFKPTSKDGVNSGIDSVFGLEMTKETVDGKDVWTYWNQFKYDGEAWVFNDKGMLDTTVEDTNGYFAVVYGSYVDAAKLPAPKDAVVWDRDATGMTFTIQNGDGLWFKINGEGKTVYDAFKAASEEFKVPYKPSVNKEGQEYGIDAMYGLEMNKEVVDGKDVWHYWSQLYKNAGDADWKFGDTFMSGIESSTYSDCLIKYV